MHCQPVVFTCLLLFLPLLITSKKANLNLQHPLTAGQILRLHAGKQTQAATKIDRSSTANNSIPNKKHQNQTQSKDSGKSIGSQSQLQSVPKVEQSSHFRRKQEKKKGNNASLLARRQRKHGHNPDLHLKSRQVETQKEYDHLARKYLNLRGKPLTSKQYNKLVNLEMNHSKWQLERVHPDPKVRFIQSAQHWKDQLKQLKDRYDRQWRPEVREELVKNIADTEQQVLVSQFFSTDSKEKEASDQLARDFWERNVFLSTLYHSGLNKYQYLDAKRYYNQYNIKVALPPPRYCKYEKEANDNDNDNDPKNFPTTQRQELIQYYNLLQRYVRSRLSRVGTSSKQLTAAEWDRIKYLQGVNHQFIDQTNRRRLQKETQWLQSLRDMKTDLDHQLHAIDLKAQEREERGQKFEYQLTQYELGMEKQIIVAKQIKKIEKIISYLQMEKILPEKLKNKHGYMRSNQTVV